MNTLKLCFHICSGPAEDLWYDYFSPAEVDQILLERLNVEKGDMFVEGAAACTVIEDITWKMRKNAERYFDIHKEKKIVQYTSEISWWLQNYESLRHQKMWRIDTRDYRGHHVLNIDDLVEFFNGANPGET